MAQPWEEYQAVASGPWEEFKSNQEPWKEFQPETKAAPTFDISKDIPRTGEELAYQNLQRAQSVGLDLVEAPKADTLSSLKALAKDAVTPTVEIGKRLGITPQTLADAADTIYAYRGLVGMEEFDWGKAKEALGEMPSRTPIGVEKAAAGTQQAVVHALDFFSSPVGVATLGAGALPQAAQKVIAGAFTVAMAKEVPGQIAELSEAIKANDTERIARAATGLGLNAAFITQGVKTVVKPFREITDPEVVIEQARQADAPATAAALEQVLPARELVVSEQAPPPKEAIQTSAELAAMENKGFAAANTAEGKRKYTPAIRRADGTIQTGKAHENIPGRGGQRGYVDEDGNFLTLLDVARKESQQTEVTPEIAGTQPREVSLGPGAASPVEFQQRLREVETPPPDRLPSVTVDASEMPSPEVVRRNKDYNLFNRINSSQAVFYFGKLGQAAKSAWEKMALGEFSMRESIGRDTQKYVTDLLGKLPRPLRKEGGKAFFDVLNGRKMEEIEAEWSTKPEGERVVSAAREVKTRLEEIRATIRDIKRDRYESYLNGLDKASLEELFRDNINKDVPAGTKGELSSALAREQFPDDWGIADGSYLPHLFFGNWKVTAKLPGAEEGSFITRSKTPQEAKVRIRQLVKNNPEMKDAQFTIEQDVSIPPDMVRLFDKRFFSLVQQMKERLEISPAEIREAQSGIIGKKSSKQKWFGSLQERKGATGYERDFERVMSAYLSGFHRWRVLSEVNAETIPLIEQVRAEGRPNAANRLEGILDNLWGKPAASSLEFDALVRQVPVLKDFIEPMALDRWTRFVRQAAAIGHLKTVRFSLINRLQPLQGLYPIVGERIIAQAKVLQHSAEGRRLLDEFGVTFDAGQYGELGARSRLRQLGERFSGERSNQELSFLSMFLHGRQLGMTPEAAGNYAKLRGQLMTQFTPLVADVPQAFEGPIAQTVFQYKRFSVKQLELIGRMAKEGELTGLGRMAAVLALTGGLSYYMRQFYTPGDTRHKVRKSLEDEFGEAGAQAILYGLPGLVGADLSGSLILGDRPIGNIYEKIGRVTTGPAVSTAIELGRVVGTKEREPISAGQKALTAAKRIPALKPLTELIDLENRNVDVLTPDGETAYRRTIRDVIVSIGSFRSANESNIKTAVDAVIRLKKESAELKNRYYVETQKENGNTEPVETDIDKFNQRWPEAAITGTELKAYIKMRSRGASKTDVERVGGKKFRSLVE